MKYLITGATGGLGSAAVAHLLTRIPAGEVAVSVRDPAKAEDLRARGVDVRRGDYEDPATLDSAFRGIERLLLVSSMGDNPTRIRHHLNAVAAARRAGVRFLAYTSIAKADTSTLSLAEVHQVTEKAIRESGIAFALLRNNWYIENETAGIRASAAGAPLVTSAGEGRTAWAPRTDYAVAAANVLAGSGHENRIYELSGPPATYADLARALSRALGREVPLRQVDDAAYRQGLVGMGVPEDLAGFYTGFQTSIREGALDVKSRDFETLLGRPVTSLEESVAGVLKGLAVTAR